MKKYNLAILGVTGAVGQALLNVLEGREFPVANLYPLASHRSVGKTIAFRGEDIPVLDVASFDFSCAQIALFSAGAETSRRYASQAAGCGCLVVDNTSCFRYCDDVPLIVPEVNGVVLDAMPARRIIANPNCSTIQMLVALKPLHDIATVKHINVATYQAVSGAGATAIDELATQSRLCLSGAADRIHCEKFPKQIAFNILPLIDELQENGYTREEMKMVWETKKILSPHITLNATAARVPVFYGHSEAVHCEFEREIGVEEACQALRSAPGVELMQHDIPTAVTEGSQQDAVFVGRLRADAGDCKTRLNMWVVADNIRKGAALNAVQICELMILKSLI
jgi:aspartate-semialdehyde dehydrogenase